MNLKIGPLRFRLVRSDTIVAGSSRLTLIARVISFNRRRATIRKDGFDATGMQFADVAPVAVVASERGWRRLLPIVNVTRLILWALAGVCVASYVASRAVGRTLEEEFATEKE